MEKEVTKLTANDTIKLILARMVSGDPEKIFSIVEDYMKTLSSSGDVHYQLKSLMRQKPIAMKSLDNISHSIKNLIVNVNIDSDHVYLPKAITKVIDDLLKEWKCQEVFSAHNIKVRNKILLHGATGNGKTTIARHIAKISQLPFVEIKTDQIIASTIGSTGANIHNIFKEITMPCVVFWDEVDTIGQKRGQDTSKSSAGHENDRMVNSMLINIEKMNKDVVFIGATNRIESLDCAFLRRFDLKLEIPMPSDDEAKVFVNQLCEFHNIPKDLYSLKLPVISYSEIKMDFIDSARKHLISQL